MGFIDKRLEYGLQELLGVVEVNYHWNCHLHNTIEKKTFLGEAEILMLITIESDLFIERECRSTILDMTSTE
jgi:hypothetical protein